jgi:DNA-directed RNA polymerase II subunit RPB1
MDSNKKSKIYMPINFTNLIIRIKNQLKITTKSLSDISPMDAYEIIDNTYDYLNKMFSPCKKFKIVYKYYMNPYILIHVNKFHRDGIILLCELIINIYKKSIVNPGEMVGMVSAQSIGEPTTQMTLNTFHYAGVSSKSNVTRGVPRIEEILTLTKNPKNPSLTIYLKPEDQYDINAAYKIASKLEHTKLSNIIKKAEIYYEPHDFSTQIDEDDLIMKEYIEFTDIINECYGKKKTNLSSNDDGEKIISENANENNWIMRIELDETLMLDMNISNEDIHYSLKSQYGNDIECFYTDYNSDNKIIFRIRLLKQKKQKDIFTEEDIVHHVKMYLENMLKKSVIRGINNIEKVNLRKITNYRVYNDDTCNYDEKSIYVLDTIGSNLSDVLKLDYINTSKSFSNDIIEMKNVLGIEAARMCLFNEISEVMEFDSTYINHHHIHLLCDRMCYNHKLVSIFRHGINKDDIGPIAKASFEETTEMFLKAAKHGELDNMRGVSANVMCGQEGYYGTSSFQLYIDSEIMNSKKFAQQLMKGNNNTEGDEEEKIELEEKKNKDKNDYCSQVASDTDKFEYDDNPEKAMDDIENEELTNNSKCPIENLKTATALNIGNIKNKIIDNDYDLNI